MYWIFGDTHGFIDGCKMSMENFPQQAELSKQDFVVVCGDFGFVWDYRGETSEEKYWLDWLNDRSFTTLFVLGNHECFPRIYNDYLRRSWNGGEIVEIRPSVFCLLNGNVFEIDGFRFFVMGGATSIDKAYREDGKSWWPEEMPDDETYQKALANLDANNWEVDAVFTHCAPDSIQHELAYWYEKNKLTNFLESIKDDLSFGVWLFGHYHVDRMVGDHFIAIYDNKYKIVE